MSEAPVLSMPETSLIFKKGRARKGAGKGGKIWKGSLSGLTTAWQMGMALRAGSAIHLGFYRV